MKFSTDWMATAGLVESDIDFAQFRFRVTSVISSDTYTLYQANTGDSNWGAAVTSDATDWLTTVANTQDTIVVSSTGTKRVDLVVPDWNWDGLNYVSLQGPTAGGTIYKQFSFGAQEHATASYRPAIEVTLKSGQIITRTLLGVGL